VEGVEEEPGPGPGSVEVRAAAVGSDAGGDVEHAVTDGFGGRSAELTDNADALRPAEQVVRAERQIHPGLVVHDVVEGQVREAAGFGVADDILCTRPLTLLQLERGGQNGDVIDPALPGPNFAHRTSSGSATIANNR